MKYVNWLKIQKCYPYPLIFESVKKIMDFCKKKKKIEKNYKNYRPEKWIDYAHYHSPQSIRFVVVVWYHKYFFQFFFFFFYDFYIFDPHCPVQVNGENFQVQNFAFLTSELKSTLNFSLENISYSVFWPTFFFHTKCLRNPGQILNPVICMLKWAHPSLTITFIMFMFSTIYMQAIG